MEELIQLIRDFDRDTQEALARQLQAELDCGCLEAYDEFGEYDPEATRHYVRLNTALATALRGALS